MEYCPLTTIFGRFRQLFPCSWLAQTVIYSKKPKTHLAGIHSAGCNPTNFASVTDSCRTASPRFYETKHHRPVACPRGSSRLDKARSQSFGCRWGGNLFQRECHLNKYQHPKMIITNVRNTFLIAKQCKKRAESGSGVAWDDFGALNCSTKVSFKAERSAGGIVLTLELVCNTHVMQTVSNEDFLLNWPVVQRKGQLEDSTGHI